jgi:hypothetical protein
MKSRWNLLAYVFTLCFLFVALAGAQGPGKNFDKRFEAMKTRLALTDDQAAKVKEILKTEGEAWGKDWEKYGDDREAMMKAGQERGKKTDAQIQALLTESQRKEYAKMKEEQRKRYEERAKQMNQ